MGKKGKHKTPAVNLDEQICNANMNIEDAFDAESFAIADEDILMMPDDSNELLPLLELLDIDTVELDRIEAEQRLEAENEAVEKKQRNENGTPTMKPIDQQDISNKEVKHFFQSNEIDTVELIKAGNVELFLAPTCSISHEPREIDANIADADVAQIFASECGTAKVFSAVELDAEVAAADEWVAETLAAENLVLDVSTTQLQSSKIDNLNSGSLVTSTTKEPIIETPGPNDTQNIYRYQDIRSKATKILELSSLKVTEFNSSKLSSIEKVVSEHDTMSSDISLAHMYSSDAFGNIDDVLRKPACALKSIQLMKSAMKADTSVGKSYTFKSVSKRDLKFQIPKFDPLFTTLIPKSAAEIKKKYDNKTNVEMETTDGDSFFKPTMSLYKPHNFKQSAVWSPNDHEAAPLDNLNLLEINKSNVDQATEKVKNVEKAVALNNTKQMVEISVRQKFDVNKRNIFSGNFNSTKEKTLNESVNSNLKSVPSNYKTIIPSNLSSIQHITTDTSEPKQANNFSIENVTDLPKNNNIILSAKKNGNDSSQSSSTSFSQKEAELKKHGVVKSVPEYSIVKNIINEQRKLTTAVEKIQSIKANTRILKGIHLIHVEKSVGKFSVTEKKNSNSALLTPRINGKILPQMNSNYNSIQTVGFSEEKHKVNNFIKPTSSDQRNSEEINTICSKLKSSSKEAAMKNLDFISKAAKSEKTKSVFIEEDSEIKSCTIKQDKRVAPSYLPMSIKNNTETKNQSMIKTDLLHSYNKVIKPVPNGLNLDMKRSKSTFIPEPRDKAKTMMNVNLTSIQLEFSETKGIDIGMKMATNTILKEQDNIEPSVTALFYRNPKTAVLIKPELITFEKSLERNKNTDMQNNVTNYVPIEDFKVMQNISSLSQVISKETYDDKTTYSVTNNDLHLEGICIAEKKDIKLVHLEQDNVNKRVETSINEELPNKTMMTDFNFLIANTEPSDSDSVLTTKKKVNKSIEMNPTHAVHSITSPHFQPTIQNQAAIPMLESIQMSEKSLQFKKLLPKENEVKKTVTMNIDNNVKAVDVFNMPEFRKEVTKKTDKLIKTRPTSSKKNYISNLKTHSTSTEDFKLLQSFPSSCTSMPQNVALMTKCDAHRKKIETVNKKSVPINHDERFKECQSSFKPLNPGKMATYKRLKIIKNDNSRISNGAKECNTIERTASKSITFVPQKGSSMKNWNQKRNANKEILNDKKNVKVRQTTAKLTPTKQNDTTETVPPPVITFVPQKGAHIKEWSLQLQKNNTSSKGNSDVKTVTEKLRLEKTNLSQNVYSPLLRVVSEKNDTMKRDLKSVATKPENLNNSKTLTANVNANKSFLDPESNITLKKDILVKPSFLPLLTPNGYRCLCNRQFENRTNLRTHVIEIHEKMDKRIRSFECNLCTKRYFSKKNLKSHFLVIHKNMKKFICNSCGKKFETKTKLRLHINCKHAKLRECKCTICFKTFLTEKHVIRHVNSVHYTIREFSCPTCANVFDSSTHLRSHIRIVHEKLRNFHCDQCEAKFSTNSNMRRHVRIVHENIRGHTCKVCLKEFISTSHLNRHFNIMHKHFRLYKCSECGLSKSTKSNLQNHVRSHSKQNKSK